MAYNKKYAELGESVIDYVNEREDAIEHGFDTLITGGTNSNGSWTKFPDGTMICRADITLNYVAPAYLQSLWEFPQEFLSPPTITGSVQFNSMVPQAQKAARLGGVGYWSKDNRICYPRIYSTASEFTPDNSVVVSLTAIGRWK